MNQEHIWKWSELYNTEKGQIVWNHQWKTVLVESHIFMKYKLVDQPVWLKISTYQSQHFVLWWTSITLKGPESYNVNKGHKFDYLNWPMKDCTWIKSCKNLKGVVAYWTWTELAASKRLSHAMVSKFINWLLKIVENKICTKSLALKLQLTQP